MLDSSSGRIHQINVSGGGVPKLPIETAFVDHLGLAGDVHTSEDHGGPDRAVCLYSLELIEQLRTEGHPAHPGSMGENLTVTGLGWAGVQPGARLLVGDEVLLEITSYTTPCSTIQGSFSDGKFSRISQKTHPGESRVYARVLETGKVQPGDEVRLVTT